MEIEEIKHLMMTYKQMHETPSRFIRIFTTHSDAAPSSNMRKRHDQAYGLFNKYVREVFGEWESSPTSFYNLELVELTSPTNEIEELLELLWPTNQMKPQSDSTNAYTDDLSVAWAYFM